MERNRGGGGVRRVAAIVVTGLLLALAACSDDGSDAAGPTTTASAADPTTTTGGRDTTTSTTAAPCDTDLTGVPTAPPIDGVADLDGDGVHDAVFALAGADGWRLYAFLDDGDGGAVSEALPTVPSDTAHMVTGRDLDGDGDDELFVVVGNGAAAQIYGIYDLDGCDLEAVQLDGRPAELAVGGSVVELHGLRCDDDGLTVLTATSDDGVDYTTDARTYALDPDGTLQPTDTHAGTTTSSAADFPELSQFDC